MIHSRIDQIEKEAKGKVFNSFMLDPERHVELLARTKPSPAQDITYKEFCELEAESERDRERTVRDYLNFTFREWADAIGTEMAGSTPRSCQKPNGACEREWQKHGITE